MENLQLYVASGPRNSANEATLNLAFEREFTRGYLFHDFQGEKWTRQDYFSFGDLALVAKYYSVYISGFCFKHSTNQELFAITENNGKNCTKSLKCSLGHLRISAFEFLRKNNKKEFMKSIFLSIIS